MKFKSDAGTIHPRRLRDCKVQQNTASAGKILLRTCGAIPVMCLPVWALTSCLNVFRTPVIFMFRGCARWLPGFCPSAHLSRLRPVGRVLTREFVLASLNGESPL